MQPWPVSSEEDETWQKDCEPPNVFSHSRIGKTGASPVLSQQVFLPMGKDVRVVLLPPFPKVFRVLSSLCFQIMSCKTSLTVSVGILRVRIGRKIKQIQRTCRIFQNHRNTLESDWSERRMKELELYSLEKGEQIVI